MKMDELAVRSACAWNSKIAKCRRPHELVIRHEQVKAKHDLVSLNMDQDTEESYLQANRVILNEAISLAAASRDRVLAALVWNGISRSDNDITRAFGDTARSLGLRVLEVSTF